MKLLNEYVAVEKISNQKAIKTKKGLVIPKLNEVTPEYHEGMVVAIAESKSIDDNDFGQLKIGDTILYKHYRNMSYKTYELIIFKDIIAIV